MANDLYLFNGTAQIFDATTNITDLDNLPPAKLIPPGSQGHLTYVTPGALAIAQAHFTKFGAVDASTIANPSSAYSGLCTSPAVIVLGSFQPPIV